MQFDMGPLIVCNIGYLRTKADERADVKNPGGKGVRMHLILLCCLKIRYFR